ncbi:MAG: hypothetical protein K0U78_15185 [Actinomycetia bacterium]|nr:hypothetical protein [Actinomycetes bacterium]
MTDITVNLQKQIEYSHKGELLEASFVTILPTSTKHIHLTSVLKQAFQCAAVKLSKDEKPTDTEEKEDGKDEKLTPSEIMSTIYMGGKEINIKEVVLTGKELMTSGVVLVEGEEKLTKPLCDKLSQEDYEEILGTIMVNFIIASLIK